MVDKRTLMQVQSENWRNHDSGGVDPDVMADIGFTPFEQFPEIAQMVPDEQVARVARATGRLSSAQQNANETAYIRAHRQRAQRQIMGPYDTN